MLTSEELSEDPRDTLANYLIKTRRWQGVVTRSVMTSSFVDAVAKKYGVGVKETPVGFKYIGDILVNEDMVIGGEESGGLTIKGHVPEKDGILACLLMAEMVATEKKSIGKIRNVPSWENKGVAETLNH